MAGLEERAVSEIWFVSSTQPVIDRGWDPSDVQECILRHGFRTRDIFVLTEAELRSTLLCQSDGDVLVWPVCYTLNGDVEGKLLADMLEELGVAFIGSSARGLATSSKIFLRSTLERRHLPTPRFLTVTSETVDAIPLAVPYVMKCEFSCDSQGVRVVCSAAEARAVWTSLVCRYCQRVIAEEWVREREFTVSYIPHGDEPVFGSLELCVSEDRLIIDEEAKRNNSLVRFSVPEESMGSRLAESARRLAAELCIDGYFRADFLLDSTDTLYVVDVNFLPQMHFSEDSLSYFPMALRETLGMNPEQTVCLLLDAARQKWHLRYAGESSAWIDAMTSLAAGGPHERA
jgi:D-alanine-D-alanine ligase-like ATP-grasp enzyme